MTQDALFSHIEEQHKPHAWGRVLDAGTGDHSLRWLLSIPAEQITAVTVDTQRMSGMQPRFAEMIRPQDRLVLGDWQDESLLGEETFDVVLLDYLIGAIDAFTPFFQDRIIQRLARHAKSRLYIVGLEPFPAHASDPAAQGLIDLARFQDACRLHAGLRPYREYPAVWVERRLHEAGFHVLSIKHFGNVFRAPYLQSQARACRQVLAKLPSLELRTALLAHLEALEATLLSAAQHPQGIRLSSDYVIVAERSE